MRRFWRLLLGLGRWGVVGEVPPIRKMVIIGAHHTSNWDFVIGMLAARALGVRIRFLGKHTLFRAPFGWFFRMLGGIPVDRSHPGGVITQVTAEFARSDDMILVIAPEGTRRHLPYWRSGFYEIARSANVPVVLAALDAGTRRVRIGPIIETTGGVTADMDRIREFFARYRGIKPEKAGTVRLKAEDG